MNKGLLGWLPPGVASYIYNVIFKPVFLRKFVHWLICRFIPSELDIRGATVCLNQRDAIVSGNLALGCYEAFNLDFFSSHLQPGITFMDIGANIGVYTAVAAKHIGVSGTVIAVEPDESNCSFIRRTIRRNGFTNTTVIQKAAGNRCGNAELFLCDLNKADHRIYDATGDRPKVIIEMTTVDAILESTPLTGLDLIKMDVQGAELLVFHGMQKTLRVSPKVKIILEFWPWGIERAGGNPAELLEGMVSEGFKISLIDGDYKRIVPVANFTELVKMNKERQHFDLYLSRF